MALGNISGIAYVVPDDPGHPDVLPEDTKGIAASIAARLREWGLRLNERVDTLTSRVDAMAVASGTAPGTPEDGMVAGFVLDATSKTRSALFSVLDVGPVHISRFGAKGDGVADDTAALVAAGASGREVHFSPGAVHNFRGPVTISEGTRWVTNGARLYCTTPRSGYNIVLQSDTFVDVLDASFADGNDDRGVDRKSVV